ncbi:MAG TPA: hypothetical protein VG099_03185, partial [Gemmataceae bacterium]|nr:hypothetical protein [Gemmataceae bacterium]
KDDPAPPAAESDEADQRHFGADDDSEAPIKLQMSAAHLIPPWQRQTEREERPDNSSETEDRKVQAEMVKMCQRHTAATAATAAAQANRLVAGTM